MKSCRNTKVPERHCRTIKIIADPHQAGPAEPHPARCPVSTTDKNEFLIIRYRDELFFTGARAPATGRTAVPVVEFLLSDRGAAIRVRKIKRL